jgi:hypothetical protein
VYLDQTAQSLEGGASKIRLTSVPDVCPQCQRSIHPKPIFCALLAERSLSQMIYRCPHQGCQELFIASYRYTSRSGSGGPEYGLIHVAPIAPHKGSFSETIKDLSPTFVEIYDQAISAESNNLNQLVGIGLRKAIEFLIKDFSCSQHPDKDDEIRSTWLGTCISNYINDTNVKECSRRAAWLGNDETHYTRRWDDRDIDDLKLLVKLTVNWIENVLLTQKYISEMSDSKA